MMTSLGGRLGSRGSVLINVVYLSESSSRRKLPQHFFFIHESSWSFEVPGTLNLKRVTGRDKRAGL